MSLRLYNKKRNFGETPEPGAEEKKAVVRKGTATKSPKSATKVDAVPKTKLSFVVQRHKASRLHYDFRLELGGVLKSWAVPRGPSMNPADKRLAMEVEDHPFEYKDFRGVIPEGNYGAGIVEIWDKGFYTALTDDKAADQEKLLRAGYKKGDFKFVLKGKKLKGEFVLVKIKNRFGGKENTWLLIKHKDGLEVNSAYDSENETLKTSPINKALEKEKGE